MLKRILNKITGNAPDWASQAIGRYPFLEPHENYHLQRVAHDLLKKTGGEVFAGPLAGMKLPLSSPLSNTPYHVIGCYEQEIHGILAEVICCPPPLIIDIGSAFGYYTVGLACKTKDTRIIGFEADKEAHWENARQLAELNEVTHRIEQKGFCDSRELEAAAQEGAFILCDCEGGEMNLLDPEIIPALSKCHILAEIHEFLVPRVAAHLVNRFGQTHKMTLHFEQTRNSAQYRILDGLSSSYKELSVKETRFSGNKLVSALFIEFKPV
jgi:hypothetical protein